ncbi:MAG: type IV pilus assembly protein PilM [Candidatus Omnitrophica bacterium]|nr:type IV pilus assembly protein PilM [Candidatus Omnitrophota bacterium]
MAKLPDLVIDIGHQKIKVLQIQVGKKGGIRVVKAGEEPLIAGEGGEEEESLYRRIQDTIPILLQRLGIKGKRAIVSLPGRSAFTRRLRVPMVRGRQMKRIVQYEARQHVPFPLDQVNMDYQVTEAPGDLSELEVNLVAVRREISDAYTKSLKKCGIRSDIIEVSPLSIYNAYAATPHRNEEDVTAVVSIGASSTDIVIEQNGVMQFMRSAPVAGNALTKLLAKNLDISLEEAEAMKKKPSSEFADSEGGASAEKVSSVLEKGFEQVVTEVRRSFDFYVSQPDALPVTRVFLCGGTSRMEGVTEFLEDRLGVPVLFLDGTEIEGLEFAPEYADIIKYEAQMVGMASRAAGKGACLLSFAPQQIKDQLEFERRVPMFGIMALLIAAMIGGSVFFLDKMLATTANAVERVKEIVEPSQQFSPQLAAVRNEQNLFNERYSRIEQVADKRGTLSRVYLEVQNLVPQDIWLDSIEVTSRQMTIKGKSLNDERVSTYIQHLIMSPFFDNEIVVLSDLSPSSDITGSGPVQMDFTISIRPGADGFNNPTDEEIHFVEELRKLTKEGEVLLIKFEHMNPQDPTSDATLVIGVYEQDESEKIQLIRKVFSCLVKSKDEAVKTLDLRFHDRESNLTEHLTVTRELVAAFWDKRKTQEDLVQGFTQITPSPSPTPSPTPTPEKEGDEGASTGMGAYGMYGGMYGGMMGMPGAGG